MAAASTFTGAATAAAGGAAGSAAVARDADARKDLDTSRSERDFNAAAAAAFELELATPAMLGGMVVVAAGVSASKPSMLYMNGVAAKPSKSREKPSFSSKMKLGISSNRERTLVSRC